MTEGRDTPGGKGPCYTSKRNINKNACPIGDRQGPNVEELKCGTRCKPRLEKCRWIEMRLWKDRDKRLHATRTTNEEGKVAGDDKKDESEQRGREEAQDWLISPRGNFGNLSTMHAVHETCFCCCCCCFFGPPRWHLPIKQRNEEGPFRDR